MPRHDKDYLIERELARRDAIAYERDRAEERKVEIAARELALQRYREMLAGDNAGHVHVERVARLLARLEFSGQPGVTEEEYWSRWMTLYRQRARKVLTDPKGWETLGVD